ncbi:hypothetical protein AMTR_s00062p00215220 [Amborella trichopoda]|uniref:Uncharacterized protein n=1 Tax=Amborella trichopoda TaxID=13333 RepID=U5DB42_AMBTC|nr:hypothetical protein AMTR_s00062p00215220 [Amborella trichopoda]
MVDLGVMMMMTRNCWFFLHGLHSLEFTTIARLLLSLSMGNAEGAARANSRTRPERKRSPHRYRIHKEPAHVPALTNCPHTCPEAQIARTPAQIACKHEEPARTWSPHTCPNVLGARTRPRTHEEPAHAPERRRSPHTCPQAGGARKQEEPANMATSTKSPTRTKPRTRVCTLE